MQIIIVESSGAKMKLIQSFVGRDYKVMACMGHIRVLKEDLDAHGLGSTFEPAYEVMATKRQVLSNLREAYKSADGLILATDDDREGEAMAYHLCVLLKADPVTVRRIVFHEITKTAITAALAKPSNINLHRVHSQQTRAVLDLMIGFSISPLLWTFVLSGPLSAGRCQTPALRLLVDREKEIEAHTAVSSFRVRGTWQPTAMTPKATFHAAMDFELEDAESARTYLENVHAVRTATVTETKEATSTQNPPKPYTTSTLQQDASSRSGMPPKTTMSHAQSLYNQGHITYMRTDNTYICDEARAAIGAEIGKRWGADQFRNTPYMAATGATTKGKGKGKTTKDEAKGGVAPQAAHEAIRPTHMEIDDLPGEEPGARRLYQMIWARTMQSQMLPALYRDKTLVFVQPGFEEWTWRATWSVPLQLGWQTLDPPAVPEEDQTMCALFSQLAVGKPLQWLDMEATEEFTQPPSRYTEASLIKKLEDIGIGRPSTFSSLVSTVLEKQYAVKGAPKAKDQRLQVLTLPKPGAWPPLESQLVKKAGGKEKDKLQVTDLGFLVIDFLVQHFCDLFDYGYTAKMEAELDAIADGRTEWKAALKEVWEDLSPRVSDMMARKAEIKAACNGRSRELRPGLIASITKKGPLLIEQDTHDMATDETAAKEGEGGEEGKGKGTVWGWPAGATMRNLTLEEAEAFVAQRRGEKAGIEANVEAAGWGEWEGHTIEVRDGKFGPYMQAGDVRVSLPKGSTVADASKLSAAEVRALFEAKASAYSRTVGAYVIRQGAYGLYITLAKQPAKGKPVFAGVPEGKDANTLTEEECEELVNAKRNAAPGQRQFAQQMARGGSHSGGTRNGSRVRETGGGSHSGGTRDGSHSGGGRGRRGRK
jgi:DNA topoisomerase-1